MDPGKGTLFINKVTDKKPHTYNMKDHVAHFDL
jgi:hypothetical protein